MFFGLCNAPATFQVFVNHIFKDLINEELILLYLDDLMIFSEDDAQHESTSKCVFKILWENRLYLKLKKCEFNVESVTFLGHVLGNRELNVDPKKSSAVATWPALSDKKELRQFLSMGNWLRRFIPGYSRIVRLLTKLTGNNLWNWRLEEQHAFEEIRAKLSNPPTLALPTDDNPFRVKVDASGFATGGVLLQEQEGRWQPIVYLSQAMTDTEWNYEIYNKEMMAII